MARSLALVCLLAMACLALLVVTETCATPDGYPYKGYPYPYPYPGYYPPWGYKYPGWGVPGYPYPYYGYPNQW